ncbi:unnamed protein product [Cyprideis torosa]|uniref:Ferric oxidoreductase domain-containing protein n=1 Tax=Cyprideis torosa TaxID=163714 RepID=A0A7R8WQ46_9CRUS|nr:unnamed protein product [Cyprideis torosa]CAG0907724.1 unnamed protein product [Cyprideis torosa]
MKPTATTLSRRIKPLVFALSLIPLGYYGFGLWVDGLGANPIEVITRGSGDWALRFLLITLAVTPVRQVLGWNWLIRLRRMLGLFAFFYASIHLVTYVWLDQFFDWPEIWLDILERPFIAVGMLSMVILTLLAATSPLFMLRKLGGRLWGRLHKLVYAAGGLGVLHFWWMKSSKSDVAEPLIYAVILAILLGYRLLKMGKAHFGRAIPPSAISR